MEQIIQTVQNLDWSPLYISLKTGIAATIVSFFLGIAAARCALKASPFAKAVLDGIFTLPLVLPPTVAGFLLLLLFSRRRPFGIFLYESMGLKVVQSWLGCVLAAVVIAFPIMYRNARAAFEQVDADLVYAGRTLGMSETAIFFKVVIPSASPRYRIRYNSGICACTWRVWSDFDACGQYSGQNRHDFPENRNGHAGRRFCGGRCVGSDYRADCICADCAD